ncbi:hypothetical protein [Phycisphaera mikurensis]|uniref:Tetratricopeptide repeat protein n=1 Tax=Phycisphaera mikurensis (strain NBRC 102666 / KCTC 22515 / FYK2301M01) TaxID=1142394 RepID=I0IE90_PHYMF|nr:hypothetical protein [Phycisphaera mikurensis]MBB6441381.1 hypothetical protein [Phycisphaera mikurensis]BAM03578.1 hypothetical protein PSMK_14190 [Phycisphaera mikurensis NBRC 102666]
MSDNPARDAAVEPADRRRSVDADPLPRFRPARLDRELGFDALLRRSTFGLVVVLVALASVGFGGPLFGLFAGICVVAAWLGFGFLNARAATSARALLPLVQQRPPLFRESEAALRELLGRRALLGWVRLSIYQVWATIRHAQGRHAEAADLCASVLARPMGPAEAARPDVLLMLVESLLETGRPAEAWGPLVALAGLELKLPQSMQRLILQLRYELAIGQPAAALVNLRQRVALAELLPARACGEVHAMLAQAAEATGRSDQAAWLRARAELLGWDGGVAAAPDERAREQARA